ncbi:hypothetical protein MMC24_002730 [Lignoscripta atroalba]|nr:hypothetical protein [Lignoscripta atroalba]
MTHNRLDSRGIQPVKLHADRYRLTTWHTSSERESGEIGQDINLGSDAGLHYKHRDNEVEDEVPITVASPGFVQRLLSFMSKTPLVMRSSLAQSTASYGAVPEDDFSLSEDTSETGLDVTDDVRRRDRRKGKESVLRHIRNARTSSSGPRSDRNSSSRNRRGGALPHADAAFATGAGYSDGNDGKLFESSVPRISSETGSSREGSDSEEDLIDIDRDSSKTSEDPIDNSLSV